MSEQAVRALREALKLSPDNLPLRQHLAETLLGLARFAEAEQEYRQALALAPDNQPVKLGLARAFYQQGKNSQALVLVEDLLRQRDTPAGAYTLHARLLLRAGEVERAVRQYKEALDLDPAAADPELAAQLGVGPGSDEGEVVGGKVRAAWEGLDDAPEAPVERPGITFKDVGGMDAVKDEIRMKIIHPLAHPELTFERARSHPPCVLFFDEVDALGASRADLRHSSGRQLINQFLAELDGVQSSNEGVLILAATNAPWHLDAAFRRPGRFDRVLFVPPPDTPARAAILRILLHGKPSQDIDFDHLAKKTENFSGADLKAVLDVAVEQKLREAMKAGVPKPLTTKDLLAAAATLRPTTKEWFATARNYALYSNQGGIYDDILKYLKI